MLEMPVAALSRRGWSRARATVATAAACWVCGLAIRKLMKYTHSVNGPYGMTDQLANNWHRTGAANHTPDKEGIFDERRKSALEAYFQRLPVSAPSLSSPIAFTAPSRSEVGRPARARYMQLS